MKYYLLHGGISPEDAESFVEEWFKSAAHSRSEAELVQIYDSWGKQPEWTIEEAAALLTKVEPGAYERWPREKKRTFDVIVDLLRRKSTNGRIKPAELRTYCPSIEIENRLLWTVIDRYHGKRTPRKSDESRKENKIAEMFLGLALNLGFNPDEPEGAVNKIKRQLDKVGIPADEKTIKTHLMSLAKDERFEKIIAEFPRP